MLFVSSTKWNEAHICFGIESHPLVLRLSPLSLSLSNSNLHRWRCGFPFFLFCGIFHSIVCCFFFGKQLHESVHCTCSSSLPPSSLLFLSSPSTSTGTTGTRKSKKGVSAVCFVSNERCFCATDTHFIWRRKYDVNGSVSAHSSIASNNRIIFWFSFN